MREEEQKTTLTYNPIRLFFTYSGRIGRVQWLIGWIYSWVAFLLTVAVGLYFFEGSKFYAALAGNVVVFFLRYAIDLKRYNDLEYNSLWVLVLRVFFLIGDFLNCGLLYGTSSSHFNSLSAELTYRSEVLTLRLILVPFQLLAIWYFATLAFRKSKKAVDSTPEEEESGKACSEASKTHNQEAPRMTGEQFGKAYSEASKSYKPPEVVFQKPLETSMESSMIEQVLQDYEHKLAKAYPLLFMFYETRVKEKIREELIVYNDIRDSGVALFFIRFSVIKLFRMSFGKKIVMTSGNHGSIILYTNLLAEFAKDYKDSMSKEVNTLVFSLIQEILPQAKEESEDKEDSKQRWFGKTECDICHREIQESLYDAKRKDGNSEWATMCEDCFHRFGIAVRWGTGQKYHQSKDGYFYLVDGFPPEE